MCMQSERLLFEPLVERHASLLFDALGDSRLYTYIPAVEPVSVKALASRFARLERGSETDERWLNWVMVDREARSPVGTLQATAERRCAHRVHRLAAAMATRSWVRGRELDALSRRRARRGLSVRRAD